MNEMKWVNFQKSIGSSKETTLSGTQEHIGNRFVLETSLNTSELHFLLQGFAS